MMARVPLIEGDETYLLTDSTGKVQMRLIQVVGEGGTYIAYKAVEEVDGIAQNVSIILEFYPCTEEETFSMLQYTREKPGQELKLIPKSSYMKLLSDEQKKTVYEEEICKQEENALREIETARTLFYNKEKKENSPYLYRTEYFTRMGDTYYLKLDTSEGQTLRDYIKEQEEEKLSLRESLELTRKILEILSQLLEGVYIHGDIKPQNIWICGKGAAMSMKLLDMGSFFSLQEYRCPGFEAWSKEEIIQKADDIVKNRGIGCSTKGYCNSDMSLFFDAKTAYYSARELAALNPLKVNIGYQYKAAVRLLDAMNRLRISVDLYSVVETMFYCVAGKNYSGEMKEELEELIQESRMVCQYFAEILRKNQGEGYLSVEELRKDLKKLEKLLNKEADPDVLLEAIQNTLPDIQNIEPGLFGKIK